jgi:colanic acid biosynthesis glycosyl transferase WcaI
MSAGEYGTSLGEDQQRIERAMKKKRVLLLTQWFEPEPTFKGLVFARELVQRGYEVEVVTGFPNYPGGKVYPGYKISLLRRELIEGVEVTRLALYPSHDASAVRRVANYVSFAVSALVYCLFFAKKPDLIYVYQLPTLGVVAAYVRIVRGVPYVFDVQDIWPETLRATGMVGSETILSIVGRVAKQVYARAAAVVVLSPGFRRMLVERGVDPAKIELIYNWCDEEALRQPQQGQLDGFPGGGSEKFRIMFAGNIGKAQSLGAVLDAADELRSTNPRITFVFIGGGVEVDNLKSSAERRGLNNVLFLPRVGINRIGAFLQAADALLVHLKADPLFTVTIPGKTQAYMAMGKPILVAVPGDATELVRQAGCGVEAIPENGASIAAAAVRLAACSNYELRGMGDRAKAFYKANLALSVGVDRFATLFDSVIQKGPSRSPRAESLTQPRQAT